MESQESYIYRFNRFLNNITTVFYLNRVIREKNEYIFLLCKVAFNMTKPSRTAEMRSAIRTRGKIRCIAITASGMYLPSARKKVQLYRLR